MSKIDAIKKAKEKIEALTLMIDFIEQYLPDDKQFDFPVNVSVGVTGSKATTYVDIPYNLDFLRQFRRAMGRGWQPPRYGLVKTDHESHVSFHVEYVRPEYSIKGSRCLNKFPILVSLDPRLEKSVCHMEKVGVKEVPIWKIVCE